MCVGGAALGHMPGQVQMWLLCSGVAEEKDIGHKGVSEQMISHGGGL